MLQDFIKLIRGDFSSDIDSELADELESANLTISDIPPMQETEVANFITVFSAKEYGIKKIVGHDRNVYGVIAVCEHATFVLIGNRHSLIAKTVGQKAENLAIRSFMLSSGLVFPGMDDAFRRIGWLEDEECE